MYNLAMRVLHVFGGEKKQTIGDFHMRFDFDIHAFRLFWSMVVGTDSMAFFS
jgi:hypothetical protein